MTQTQSTSAVSTQWSAPAEPVNLLKRIGSTTYEVVVCFSKTSTETMSDKLLRLIEREAVNDCA